MIAYNKLWLDNAALQEEVAEAYRKQCLSADERTRIHEAYPVGFYTPNPYIRIGLFLLTAVIVSFSLGLFMLVFSSGLEHAWRGLLFFFGIGIYGVLELFVKDKKHYRSGVDDGLLWMSMALIFTAVTIDTDQPVWLYCALAFALTLYFTLRFADRLMAIAAVAALLAFIFHAYLLIGAMARITVPFVIMAASLLLYLLSRRWADNERWRHYLHCCKMMEISSLIAIYLAGNYFVVRELSNEMFYLGLQPGQSIPAGWLFWIFTIIIPLLYIYLGVRKKDSILLRTGVVLVAAAACTVRQYHSIMSIEAIMALCGVLLIGISYALIRYLHTPKHGFTAHPPDETRLLEKLQAESLIITETFAEPPTPAPGFKFGGGSGGGGGANGSW
jgi:uncharacterized membrane protein YgcG